MKNKLKVIKIGGKIIDDEMLLNNFLSDFLKIKHPKILVHGGGNIASNFSERLGIVPNLIEGRRITSGEDLDIVTMVYAGLINKNIVTKLSSKNCNAVGLSGADGNCIIAKKREIKEIDYGFVGDVEKINSDTIQYFISGGLVPVFSAICHDGRGQLLNTNADTIAAQIAIAMGEFYEVELRYYFEKDGVLDSDNQVIKLLNKSNYLTLKSNNIIKDGMIPKIDNCFDALENKVAKVSIGDTKIEL